MQVFNNIVTLAALFGLAAAGTAGVIPWSGGDCHGSSDPIVTVPNGGSRCFAVSNKRSLFVTSEE